MNNSTIKQNGKLIIALSSTLQTIHRKSELLFRQNGLTMAQFAVLEALLHKGDLTIGALIEAVLSTSGNMTVVIRNLELRGWVCRIENPDDKRSFLIRLTDDGRALIVPVFAQHMAFVNESLTPLTVKDRETVITILKKLA